MRFCAILILSVISILNSLELKSQTVVNILSNGYKLERSLFLHGKKIGVYNKKGRLIKLSTDDKTRQKIFLNQSNSLTDYGIMLNILRSYIRMHVLLLIFYQVMTQAKSCHLQSQ